MNHQTGSKQGKNQVRDLTVRGKDKPSSQVDVAKLAGVSDMTVHRVLQNDPRVREDTRRRVLEACATLNYRSNLVASSLRTRKSHALGLICPDLEHTYFVRLINSVEKASSEFGYHIIVVQLEGNAPLRQKLDEMEFLLQRQVDGLIIGTPLEKTISNYLSNEKVPIILTEQQIEGFLRIGTDDFSGAKEAVEYLISLGHRSIVHLAGFVGPCASEQRLMGYRQALTDAGIDIQEELVIITDYRQQGGYQATLALLDKGLNFSAIFAANDYVAVGAMMALYERGLKVPEDVSIVGFAGDSISQWTIPPLTTVSQPIEEVGKKSVELLIKQINNPSYESKSIILPTKLVVRRSCARCSRPDVCN